MADFDDKKKEALFGRREKIALFSTLFNYCTYSYWTISNKWQFMPADKGGLAVHTPLMCTSVQMIIAGLVAAFCIYVLQIGGRKPKITHEIITERILPLGIVRSVDIGCGNFALAFITVALQQIIKSLIPVFVCFLTVTLLKKPVTVPMWLTLVPIVGGTVMASFGAVSFSVFGVVLATISSVGRGFKAILNYILLHSGHAWARETMTPLEILLLEAPTSGVIIGIVSFVFEGLYQGRLGIPTFHVFLYNLWMGTLMFFNQLSYITIIETTSAATCQILMNLKMVILISISVVVFNTSLSHFNALGMLLAAFGVTLYCLAAAKQKKDERSAPASPPGRAAEAV